MVQMKSASVTETDDIMKRQIVTIETLDCGGSAKGVEKLWRGDSQNLPGLYRTVRKT